MNLKEGVLDPFTRPFDKLAYFRCSRTNFIEQIAGREKREQKLTTSKTWTD